MGGFSIAIVFLQPVFLLLSLVLLVPSGSVKITIEQCHLSWIYPLKMMIFHSYVRLPEGTKLWKITIFNGKIHYKCPFSMAM